MRKIAVSGKLREDPVQRARRGEVAAERLLDDDAGALGAARRRAARTTGPKSTRRDREVVRRSLRGAELACGAPRRSPGRRSRRRRSAAGSQSFVEGRRVEPAVLLEAVLRAGRSRRASSPPWPRRSPARRGAALQHRLERREDLLVGEIARGAEEDQGVRACGVIGLIPRLRRLLVWPPNWKRIAESSLSGKSASPRELKRS